MADPGNDQRRPLGDGGGAAVVGGTSNPILPTTVGDIAFIGEVSRQLGWECCAYALIDAGHAVASEAARLGYWRHPRYSELEERRRLDHEPCSVGRHRDCGCSKCIHAEAWRARGGRPYLGVRREAELRRAGAA